MTKRMEKVEEFRVGSESIEDWLDGFEARLEALEIRENRKKGKWCRAVIGSVGRGILKNLDPALAWNDVKAELKRYLGEEDERTAAWRNLRHYRAEGKSLGEIAADVLGHARSAATEEDVQQRLAVEAFLEAIPWRIAKELRRKRLDTLKKALEEAKFIMAINEEEEKKELQVKKVSFQEDVPTSRPRGANREEEPRRTGRWGQQPRNIVCWACSERGHVARNCPLFKEWKEYRNNRGTSPQRAPPRAEGTDAEGTLRLNY